MVSPLVSVILPVFNRELFIEDAIKSILNQTFSGFELIIVDDASTDTTISKIKEIKDSRIRIFENIKNLGVSASRNLGLGLAKGDYIAFMDSDDISVPERLEKQLKVLECKPDVIICGSWVKILNSDKILKHKEFHDEIISSLLLSCPLSMGAVMYRRQPLKNFILDTSLRFGEDYEFWCRTLWEGKAYNIQEPLLLYRIHGPQLSIENKRAQKVIDMELRLELFKKMDYPQAVFKDDLIGKVLLCNCSISSNEFSDFLKWVKILKIKNRVQNIFPQKEFALVCDQILKDLLFNIFFKKTDIGYNKIMRIKIFKQLPLDFKFSIFLGKIKEYKKILFS